MRKYRNLVDGVQVPNTEREAEFVNEIINDAINDFPVDDLLKEAIAETGENDEQGFCAIVNGVIYEVTVREGYPMTPALYRSSAVMLFTDENTSGFSADEIDDLNSQLEVRLNSDELSWLEQSERVREISERIINQY